MQVEQVSRRQTFFHNDFLEAYYFSDRLSYLRTYSPTISEVKQAIQAKSNFSNARRKILATDLWRQYQDARIDLPENTTVFKNIKSLELENTFTITTGQQIHIGLGPLYVLYKILDVLAIVAECKDLHPNYNFVPVFWMATEDHDLQEIQSVNVYNQSFTWDTSQTGAVGRMNTAGISELFEELKTKMNLSEAQLRFIEASQVAYSQSANLSSAFRTLLHAYFADHGLVIMDADSENLKKEFIPVFKDELRGLNYKALLNSTEALETEGFQRQLVIRECNLFKLGEHQREKHNVMNDEEDVLDQYVKQHVFNLSPNAALRPLYQEWILPNLVYVGGASEVHYWTQLKGLFDNYEVPIPIVHLRTSNIIIPEQLLHENTDVDVTDFFKIDQSLIFKVNKEQDNLFHTIRQNFKDLKTQVYAHQNLVENNVIGFNLDAKVSKMIEKLDEINALTEKQLVSQSAMNPALNKLLKTKKKYFNPAHVQERKEDVVTFIDTFEQHILKLVSHSGFSSSQKIGILKM
jgi:bacillithiol synthase